MPSIWIAADWRHMKENGTELTKRNEKIETRTRIKSHKNSQCWECWWLEIQNAHVCSHSQYAISSKNYEPKSKMLIQFDPINLNRETIHEHKHIPKTVRGKRQSVFFLLRLESDFFYYVDETCVRQSQRHETLRTNENPFYEFMYIRSHTAVDGVNNEFI